MRPALLVIFLGCALQLNAQIASTFQTDADGWTFTAVSTSIPVTHNPANGNPDGYASVTYSSNAATTVQNWIAPAKFRGSHLILSEGMNLRFDLQQSVAGTGAGFDVILRNGGTFIYISGVTPKPAVAPAWTSYSFKLDETGGWFISPGSVAATRAQIRSVLANVTSLEIRGTYATNAAYVSGIDNVILEQRTLAPVPAATTISAASGKPGDIITINGSGFDPAVSNNKVFFGYLAGTEAEVQSASTTQLSVVVPEGAVYGKITMINTVTGLTGQTKVPFSPVFDGGGRIIPASFKPGFSIPTIGIEGWYYGDFDGDGWEDFAVTNNNSEDYIDMYRNLGLGGDLSAASFAPKVTFATPPLGGSGTNGAGLMFVDLDGDGKKDAITSNASSAFNSVFVTLRNTSTPGNFSFEAPEYWPGASDETPPYFVGDIDGDGRPDLVSGEGSSGAGTNLFISQNMSTPGNIEIGPPVGYFGATVDGLSEVQMGDLNNDGKPEMIASWFFGDRFSIIQNNSTPGVISMTDMGQILTGQYNRGMRVVDVDFDGKNDLVWKRTSGGIYIRINGDTDGILDPADFATEIILTSDLGANGAATIVDFNGDGKPDIASSDDADVGVYESVFSGGTLGVSSFSPAYQVFGAGSNSSGTGIADFNRDGKPDIIVANGASINIIQNANVSGPHISINTVSPLAAPVGATVTITGSNFSTVASENNVYFGAVKATVTSATASEIKVVVPPGASYGPVSVRIGELTSRYRLPFATAFSAGVAFNNTHFGTPVNFTLPGADYDIEVGDLNIDGLPDILAEGTGGYTFMNTHVPGPISTSSLGAAVQLTNSFINPRMADFDGDGLLDVAAVNGIAYKNNSTPASISFHPQTSLGLGASVMDLGDFNNDGKTDFAVTADLSGPGDLVLRENRTANTTGNFATGTYGSFSNNFVYNKAAAFGGVIAEDFDGDGFTDLATTNPGTDNVSVYLNGGVLKISTLQFSTRVDIAVADNPGRMYKGDFDNDGKVDIMLLNGTPTTTITVLHNTSSSGNLSFTRFDITAASAIVIAAVADLDGDGKPEILISSETGNRIAIYKNVHASGALVAASFAAPFNITVTAPRGVTTGDLNLDGKPEIIITRAGVLVVYENLIPSSFPTITSFTPTSGPVGTTVVITGTNFDPVAANNTVTFNGITAIVTASTTTTITTTVPLAATTGPIAVTVGANAATSTTDFVVTAPPVITVTQQPTPSTVCEGATVSMTTSGSGTTNITYRWQFSTTTGGTFTDLTDGGGYSNTLTSTLSINTTGNFGAGFYRCAINGDFASTVFSNEAQLTVNAIPAKPTVSFNGAPANSVITVCPAATVVLVAPAGFADYTWSNGATTAQITVTAGGTFTVVVENAQGCSSLASDAITVNFNNSACVSNVAPVIASSTTSAVVRGTTSIDLTSLITDADNNLLLSSLTIVEQPISGATATISNGMLELDYSDTNFTGTDIIVIQVCDALGECTQSEVRIEVDGDIKVYNAVSPNGDNRNEIFLIEFVEVLPDTQENKVTIFNRWGDVVFEVNDYNNTDRVFTGLNKNGQALPTGTYYYKIEFKERESLTGYISLVR